MKFSLNQYEKIYTIIYLLLSSGALLCFIAPDNTLYPFVQVFFSISLLINLMLLSLNSRVAIFLVLQEKSILLLTVLAVLSTLWSALSFSETLYRVGGFSGYGILTLTQSTLFAIYFASRYSLSDQLKLLGYMLGVSIILTILVGLLMPYYGVMGSMPTVQDMIHSGSWRGIYAHKNNLGNIMALSGAVFLVLASCEYRQSKVFLIGFCLSTLLIFLSNSSTALVVLTTTLFSFVIYKTFRFRYRILIPITIITVLIFTCLILLISQNHELILSYLGREATISGRTDIWGALITNIQQRQWLGYGFDAFWVGVANRLLQVRSPSIGLLSPTHAHNGFIDLFLDLGLIGFSLFIFGLFAIVTKSMALIRATKSNLALFPMLFITFLLQVNMSESMLMHDNLLWILYVSISITVPLELRRVLKQKKQGTILKASAQF